MALIAAISNFMGANVRVHARKLGDGLGVDAINMRRGSANLKPLLAPTPVFADTPAVSSVLIGSTVVEGNTLVYTCTLAYAAVLPAIYSISWGGGTASSGDYTSPPTFSNGVTLINSDTQIVVPAGVASFTISIATVDDSDVEVTETVPLTIGGVSATGSILDNDTTPGPVSFTLTFEKTDYATAKTDYFADYTANLPASAGGDYPGGDFSQNNATLSDFYGVSEDFFYPENPAGANPETRYLIFINAGTNYYEVTVSSARQIKSIALDMFTSSSAPTLEVVTTDARTLSSLLSATIGDGGMVRATYAPSLVSTEYIVTVRIKGVGVYAVDNWTFSVT